MWFRRTTAEDLPAVLAIIRQAQEALNRQGVDQWQNGYPTEADIRWDIAGESAYVLELNEKIVATAALWFAPEESYTRLDGKWKTDGAYAVVHRIAVDNGCKGRGLQRRCWRILNAFAGNTALPACAPIPMRKIFRCVGCFRKTAVPNAVWFS